MEEKKSKKEQFVIIGLIILISLIMVLPVNVPNKVVSEGKVVSSREWVLAKGTDGRLMTSLINHKTGMNENYTVSQFQRGDAVEFNLRKGLVGGSGISQSDTVANIYSNETEKKISKLKGELAVEKATLSANVGSSKQSVIDEAKRKLEYAKRQLIEQERLFIRDEAQFEKELISEEDYEISKGAVELFKINVKIAEEKLRTVTTGAKSEEIELIETKISALENEIDILYDKFSQYILISPISGIIERSFATDTLLVISDTTDYLAVLPIIIEEIKHVEAGQDASIMIDYFDTELTGKVYTIDRKVRNANNKPYYLVYIQITEKFNYPIQGLRVEGSISRKSILLRDYLLRFLNGGF